MKKLRKLATAALAVIFVCSLGLMLWNMLQYSAGQQTQDKALQIALENTQPETAPSETVSIPEQTVPLSPTAPEKKPLLPVDVHVRFLQEINIFGLRQINPDVLGWIYIPDTVISYPLMQTDSRDEYLSKAWDGTPNGGGSIFLEQKNNRNFTDFHTILYGHHMANGTMFGSLKHYKDQSYADSHPYIYLCTADRIFRYRVFAAYDAPVESDTYRLFFPDDSVKAQALAHFGSSNLLRSGIYPTPEDRILTLSTCTGTGIYTNRIVVQAVLDGQWQK